MRKADFGVFKSFDEKERSEKDASQAQAKRVENGNSYSDGRRVFDLFSTKHNTPILPNSTLEFGASTVVDDEAEIASNIAESDKPDRELVEDYKKVMFDEEKRLNEKESGSDTALTLSQLSARNRDPKESTFGSTYVAQSTFNTNDHDNPPTSSQLQVQEREDDDNDDDENDKKLKERIAQNKLDLDQLASMRMDDEEKSPAPRTP